MKALAAAAVVGVAFVAPTSGPQVVDVRAGAEAAKGFVVGDGRVITVAHVLKPGVTVDGRAARVLRRDARLDLALLAVPGVEGAPVRLARQDPRVIRRANASVDGSGWRRPVLELRIEVRRGDSGAPVLGPSGRVVGVVFARSRSHAGRAWAIDASDPHVSSFFP